MAAGSGSKIPKKVEAASLEKRPQRKHLRSGGVTDAGIELGQVLLERFLQSQPEDTAARQVLNNSPTFGAVDGFDAGFVPELPADLTLNGYAA